MIVKLAEKRGFCFGVEDAIELAETTLRNNPKGTVHALGPVIHNRQVVDRLEGQGLDQQANLEGIQPGETVLIRSHGVAPEVFEEAGARELNVVDATCVLVKRAQHIVRQLHEEGYTVVMVGDRNHAEVKGVIGHAPGVIVVDSEAELEAIPKRARLGVVAQTTHAPEHFGRILGAIASRSFLELKVVNTLCLEVVRRQEAMLRLCEQVEVMFVLGGLHSANAQEMARLCRETGMETYHLEGWEQFETKMVSGKDVAGVTAGASTPEWTIRDFVKKLEAVEPDMASCGSQSG